MPGFTLLKLTSWSCNVETIMIELFLTIDSDFKGEWVSEVEMYLGICKVSGHLNFMYRMHFVSRK